MQGVALKHRVVWGRTIYICSVNYKESRNNRMPIALTNVQDQFNVLDCPIFLWIVEPKYVLLASSNYMGLLASCLLLMRVSFTHTAPPGFLWCIWAPVR